MSRWQYAMRTVPNISHLLNPLEEVIRQKMIPLLTGRDNITDEERQLLALPCRLAGWILSIQQLWLMSNLKPPTPSRPHSCCKSWRWSMGWKMTCTQKWNQRRLRLHRGGEQNTNLQHQTSWTTWMGSWWEMCNLLKIRKLSYGWHLYHWKIMALPLVEASSRMPLLSGTAGCQIAFHYHVPVMPLSQLSMSSAALKGLFLLTDITATILAEVCSDVSIEPALQPWNGLATRHATAITDENARVDICVRGFWGSAHGHPSAFLDVKVFNPSAPSYRKTQPQACYSQHERAKKWAYEQRINEIEHGSFTPLIFSTTGGMGRAATVFYKRLASLLAEKRRQPYSYESDGRGANWTSQSSIMCLRGSCYRRFQSTPDSILLAISESKIWNTN